MGKDPRNGAGKIRTKIHFKLDDYIFGKNEKIWRELVSMLNHHGFKPSVGIISNLSAQHRDSRSIWRRTLVEDLGEKDFAFFNHGYNHEGDGFASRGLEEQSRLLSKSQTQLFTLIGDKPKTFGAPSNRYQASTMAALTRNGFTGVFGYQEDEQLCGPTLDVFPIDNMFGGETNKWGGGYVDINVRRMSIYVQNALGSRQNRWMVQLHPNRWSELGLQNFRTVFLGAITTECDEWSISV